MLQSTKISNYGYTGTSPFRGSGDGVVDYILSTTDYDPFGMIMNGRNYNTDKYRFGFNGQEKDQEIYNNQSTTTATFWEYDGRIGRRWNLDPKPQIFISDYAVMGNNPILNVDLLGDELKNAYEKSRNEKKTKLDEAKSKLDSYNGNENADGYKEANKAFKAAKSDFEKEDMLFNAVNKSISDLSKYNPYLYAELDDLKDPIGETVDIYVELEKGLKGGKGESLLGLCVVRADILVTDVKDNAIGYTVASKYGKNSILVIIDKSVIDKGMLLSHEGGHGLYFAKNLYEYIKWLEDHPGASDGGHGGGNPSGKAAEDMEKIYKKNKKNSKTK